MIVRYKLIWQACGNTSASTPKEILDYLNYIKHSKDKGGCPVINNERIYTRVLIQKV